MNLNPTIELLQYLRQTMQGYADQHLGKTPPQPAKAETNQYAVQLINAELLRLATPAIAVEDVLATQAELRFSAADILSKTIERMRAQHAEDAAPETTTQAPADPVRLPDKDLRFDPLRRFAETLAQTHPGELVNLTLPLDDLRALLALT
jgi:hypothetical protein